MKFWKEKNLSILTLVTLLVMSSFGSIFLSTTARSEDIIFPDFSPGDPNIWPEGPHILGQGKSAVSAGIVLISPVPNVENLETSHFDQASVFCYNGTVENCPSGFCVFSIGRWAFFIWYLREEGVHTATVHFDALMKLRLSGTSQYIYRWTDAGVAEVTVTIEGDGGGDEPTTCFVKGTKILMGNLSVKNIEEIQVNDTVKTMDMVTGEIGNDSVFELQEHSDEEMANGCVEITIENKFRVTVTPDHPIPVMEDDFEELLEFSDPNITTDGTEFAFIRAGDLEVGDRVFCGNVTNIVEYPSAKAESYSLLLKNSLTYIVVCDPLYQQQYEPPSGQFASELNDWTALTLEMHQTAEYYPLMAPAAKGNSASNVYFENLGEYFEEGVGAYALPMLQPGEE